MLNSVFRKVFGQPDTKVQDRQKTFPVQGRRLCLESLESREMLSVSPLEFDAIRTQLPDWNLSANMTDYNVIEITANELSAASLQSAINEAAQTKQDDLIVVRMDTFEDGENILRNGIENTDIKGIAENGPLRIGINSTAYGGIWIVALDMSGEVEDIRELLTTSELIVNGNTFVNNDQYSLQLTTAQELVGLDEYLNDPRFSNLKGTTYDASGEVYKSYTTVIIDSGIDYYNIDFAGKIVATYDFVNSYDGMPVSKDATDNAGHGTQVTSIAAGWLGGIAQNADIIMLKGFTDNTSDGLDRAFMDMANALQWVIDHVSEGNAYNIVSVNMSLGEHPFFGYATCPTRGQYNPFFDPYCNILHDMGIIVTAAAGNLNWNNAIISPAANPSVISVSSFEAGANIPVYNSRGPGLVDVFAPIESSSSGTSLAAPVVAGAAVLAQQLADTYLGRRLTVEEFRKLIQDTGVTIWDTSVSKPVEYKRIDIHAMAIAICNMGDVIVTNTDDDGIGSLRWAIANAKEGDTITFDVSLQNQTITLADELVIDKSLTIDAYRWGVTIDANSSSRVFNISGNATDVTLIGLTMTGGYTTSDGGGLYNSAALTIIDCMVTGNISGNVGGGIYNNGTLTVTSSVISGNIVDAYYEGGGIYNFGVLTVTDSEISGNIAGFTSGGICNNGTLDVTNSEIIGNTSYDGVGGILNYGIMTLTGSVVAGNTAYVFGGILNYGGMLTITNSTIAGNTAENDGYGSGIATLAGAVELYNTIVACNSGADVDLLSMLLGNWMLTGEASGFHNLIGNGVSSTFIDIQSGGNVLVNNIVTNMTLTALTHSNQLTGYGSGYNNGSMQTSSSPVGGILEDEVDGNIVGTDTSLLFVTIPDEIDTMNTGVSYNPAAWDLRLDIGSVAINKGDNQLAFDAGLDEASRDLAGSPRFVGTIDMGAYEYNQTIVVTSKNDNGEEYSLRWAIEKIADGGTITFDLSPQDREITLAGIELFIDKSLTIDASDLDVIIDAEGNSRIFTISGSSTEVSLVGLTITGGKEAFGGGIYNCGATLTITDCTITENISTRGGGIWGEFGGGGIFNALGTVIITSSIISRNTASSDFSISPYYPDLPLHFPGLFYHDGNGGGIYNYGGTLTIIESTIEENIAYNGGGIYSHGGTLTVIDNTFDRNHAGNEGDDIFEVLLPPLL